jgi:hypothetical protein
VLIDARAGSNMIYLPIDKLLEKATGNAAETGEQAASGAAKEQPESVTIEARGRAQR